VSGTTATDNQAVKTQQWGLQISSALCNRTVVGSGNNFAGNIAGAIRDLGTATQYVTDNEKPSPPASLTANAVSYNQIDLAWGASSDNVGVTGYTIYRGGQQIGTVGGTTLAYQDTTVVGNTPYTYTVTAKDAAGNESLPSNQASATTPPAPSSLTFAPVADAYVNESSPSTNYGLSSSLRADASPINRSFLRFNVQGLAGTVTSAKLRIYANSSSSVGHSVQGITDTTWVESAITYASFQPTLGAVVGSSGPFSGGGYIEVDVTPLVAGDGLVSLAVTTTHTTAISYGSRESANAPQLVVTLG
jgi:hypothetical protein